jgi:hypothetical protein
MWFWVLFLLAIGAVAFAWGAGYIGGSRVLSLEVAGDSVRVMLAKAAAFGPVQVDQRIPVQSQPEPEPGQQAWQGAAPAAGAAGTSDARDALLDAAIPGAIAMGMGAYQWLTPDEAVMGAVHQMTGEQIDNAFDLHQVLAAGGEDGPYQLWTAGSLIKWRGHVFEQQVVDQVQSWAGEASADTAGASNVADADATIFGRDFQMKTNADFDSIDNIHGDILIVPEGTENVPADALHLDFSELFDPSVLDGHEVIVAEGLDASGAADAWEGAVGVMAGGVDLGDMADVAFDSAVPGVGSAVRVAMSGYKRRKALADEQTRARAAVRVTQDAAEGISAATVGGVIGGVLLAPLDAVGGMGAATLMGIALGTAAGGWLAGRRSRSRDRGLIEAQTAKLDQALGAYGLQAESCSEAAEASWSTSIAEADAQAARLASLRKSELVEFERLALRDLELASYMDRSTAVQLLEESRSAMTSFEQTGWSLPAIRRRATWRSVAAGCQVDSPDPVPVLSLAMAAPNGEARVQAWLDDVGKRRGVVIAGVDAAVSAVTLQSLNDRANLLHNLSEVRVLLLADMERTLAPALNRVARETQELKDEYKIAGRG